MIERGIDPDAITIEDWVHFAWSTLFFETPALADPAKYRKWLYEALWLGELSEEMQAEIEQAEHERVRSGIGKTKAPASAIAELNRIREEREAARREREAAAE